MEIKIRMISNEKLQEIRDQLGVRGLANYILDIIDDEKENTQKITVFVPKVLVYFLLKKDKHGKAFSKKITELLIKDVESYSDPERKIKITTPKSTQPRHLV